MDIKRTFLVVVIAILSYASIVIWNQDYGEPSRLLERIGVSDNSYTGLAQPQNNADDFADRNDSENKLFSNSNQKKKIHVRTDVLDLVIDRDGGDITQLSLPKYPYYQDSPELPFQLFENGKKRLYIGQSGLIGANGPDANPLERPVFKAENDYYRLAPNEKKLFVDLKFSEKGIQYIKRFTLERGLYSVKVSYFIDNRSNASWNGNLFAQIKRDGSSDPSASTAINSATYLGAALWTKSKPYKKISMSDIDNSSIQKVVTGGWIAWLQHYFVTAWIPEKGTTNIVSTFKDPEENYIIKFTGPNISIQPNQKAKVSTTLYAGPKKQDILKALSPGLELTVDYGILWFIAQPIFWLLEMIHGIVGNWGWAIVLLTMLIKGMFFPLSAKSYKSMARMRAVAPKLTSLKERFGDNKQKMSQAMMELYKKEKINPLGGCLPILIQMPVFLSLYWVLLESVEMRQAHFIFWLHDLSVKDPFFILPIIMGGTMFVQQGLNPVPTDPMQAKVMKLMPLIFSFFFLWFPSGLVLYWIVNNCLSILQQWYITKKVKIQ